MGRAAGAGSPLHTTSLPIPTFLCVPVSQLPARPQVRASDVVLPEGAVFVVANSLAVSNKAESATKHYNLRVVECRWALRQLGLWPALTWLSVCMQAISGLWLRASISCPVLSCCAAVLQAGDGRAGADAGREQGARPVWWALLTKFWQPLLHELLLACSRLDGCAPVCCAGDCAGPHHAQGAGAPHRGKVQVC